MLDTHAVARSLTKADFTPAQADAITAAVRQAAEHGEHVTPDQFNAAVAALEAGQARLDARMDRLDARMDRLEGRLDAMTWRFAGAMVAQTLATIGAVAALLRMFPAN